MVSADIALVALVVHNYVPPLYYVRKFCMNKMQNQNQGGTNKCTNHHSNRRTQQNLHYTYISCVSMHILWGGKKGGGQPWPCTDVHPYNPLLSYMSAPNYSTNWTHMHAIYGCCSPNVRGVYKLSEDFANPYFHKYWTEMHDVTTIWKRNVCRFIVTLNAFDVHPMCDMADVQAIVPFMPNPLKHVLCDVPDCGRTSNAFKVTMKLKTFLFQMVVTSWISVLYLWKYGFAKSSDNLYAPCT